MVELVRLTPDDWQKVQALRMQMVREQPYAYSPTPEEAALVEESVWRQRLEKEQYVFAEEDGALVGMAALVPEEGLKNRHVAYIYSVYVAPSARGKGVGRMMMQELEKRALEIPYVEKLVLDVALPQTDAIKLYESLGFIKVATRKKQILVDGEYIDELEMEKFIR